MNHSQQALRSDSEGRSQPLAIFPASANSTRLAIRLWTPARRELGWTSDSPVIHLISDLISASDGSPGEAFAPCLVAYFEESSQALRAAKRIHWALLEFCQHRPHLCLGAAEILYKACDLPTESEESSFQSVNSTLGQAKPAQILIAASVGEDLQHLPGLQRRDFTVLRGSSDWRGGVHELIWTTPSNLERAQEVLKNAAQSLAQKDAQAAASQPTADFAAAGGRRVAPPTVALDEQLQPADDSNRELHSEFIAAEIDAERPKGRALWWTLGGVAVLAVVATVLFYPHSRPNAAVPASPPPAVESQPVPVQESQPVNAEASTLPSKPTADLPTPVAKPAAEPVKNARHDAPATARRESSKKVAEYEGLTEKDIPRLIRMAENDAGAGKYDEARHEFNAVLHLDPNNSEAKLGLKKLDLSEQETR